MSCKSAATVISDPGLFDEDGLIRDFTLWSEPLAESLAQDAGVGPLGEAHWKIIRAMREHYAQLGAAPAMHRGCHDAGIERQQVNKLFFRGASGEGEPVR